jgi:hypothetical protein
VAASTGGYHGRASVTPSAGPYDDLSVLWSIFGQFWPFGRFILDFGFASGYILEDVGEFCSSRDLAHSLFAARRGLAIGANVASLIVFV